MKILNERPPEWIVQGCMNQFRVNVESTFWTYGDTIYNPGGIKLPDHIVAHEETHCGQQNAYGAADAREELERMLKAGEELDRVDPDEAHIDRSFMTLSDGKIAWLPKELQDKCGKDAWWREYLANPRFRLEQEAEAYGRQYEFVCERNGNRDQRARFLFELGSHLSGPLYQVAVSPLQAREMIAVLAGQKELAV